MYFNIKLSSKNKESLNNFYIFFKNLMKEELDFEEIIKCKNKRRKKILITTLKSPHVNKKSKEQYELITYSKNMKIYTNNSGRLGVLIKRLKNSLLSDVLLKVEITNTVKEIRSPNPFKFSISNGTKYANSYIKLVRLHKAITRFNDMKKPKKSLGSSVGRAKD